ncbi:MAG: hypothetical protein ACYTXY_43000, partial [Nostoc sp.]
GLLVLVLNKCWNFNKNCVDAYSYREANYAKRLLEKRLVVRTSQLEQEPIGFFGRESESLLDDARSRLAAFVGANVQDYLTLNPSPYKGEGS